MINDPQKIKKTNKKWKIFNEKAIDRNLYYDKQKSLC